VANYLRPGAVDYPGLFFFIYLQDSLVQSPTLPYLDHRYLDKNIVKMGYSILPPLVIPTPTSPLG
jgi:hypothetical protein